MENKLNSLTLEELVALEKMISTVCKQYENLAQMNKTAINDIDAKEYQRATNSLRYYNSKRNIVLDEMEKRIENFV